MTGAGKPEQGVEYHVETLPFSADGPLKEGMMEYVRAKLPSAVVFTQTLLKNWKPIAKVACLDL